MLREKQLMPSTSDWLCPHCGGRVRYIGKSTHNNRPVLEFECYHCGRTLRRTLAVSGKPRLACQTCGFKSSKSTEIKQFGTVIKCMTCIKERR